MSTSAVLSPIEADDRGLLVSCPKCHARNRMSYVRLGQDFRCGQCHEGLGSPAEPVELSTEAAFNALISQSRVAVLIDFWAPWCPPCRAVAPEIAKVAETGAGRYIVGKVDTEDLP